MIRKGRVSAARTMGRFFSNDGARGKGQFGKAYRKPDGGGSTSFAKIWFAQRFFDRVLSSLLGSEGIEGRLVAREVAYMERSETSLPESSSNRNLKGEISLRCRPGSEQPKVYGVELRPRRVADRKPAAPSPLLAMASQEDLIISRRGEDEERNVFLEWLCALS